MLVQLFDQGTHFGNVVVVLGGGVAGHAALRGWVDDATQRQLEAGSKASARRLARVLPGAIALRAVSELALAELWASLCGRRFDLIEEATALHEGAVLLQQVLDVIALALAQLEGSVCVFVLGRRGDIAEIDALGLRQKDAPGSSATTGSQAFLRTVLVLQRGTEGDQALRALDH